MDEEGEFSPNSKTMMLFGQEISMDRQPLEQGSSKKKDGEERDNVKTSNSKKSKHHGAEDKDNKSKAVNGSSSKDKDSHSSNDQQNSNKIWKWTDHSESLWNAMVEELQRFKAKFGHCTIPVRDAQWELLARWVDLIRQDKKDNHLTQYQIDCLDEIGLDWKDGSKGRSTPSKRASVKEKVSPSKEKVSPIKEKGAHSDKGTPSEKKEVPTEESPSKEAPRSARRKGKKEKEEDKEKGGSKEKEAKEAKEEAKVEAKEAKIEEKEEQLQGNSTDNHVHR